MKLFGMCLNWKVLAGLGAVGLGIFGFAPQLFAAALPFLLLALCPLSMLLMMGSMQGMNDSRQNAAPSTPGKNLSRSEQIAQLKTQQIALADQLAALEREDAAAPLQAEGVGRAVQPS